MDYEIVDAQYVIDHIGKVPLVDVRPRDMYLEGHIPTAVWAGLMEAKNAVEDTPNAFLKEVLAAGIDPQCESIVYCQNGTLAKEACELLAEMGYTAQKCYEGSWTDWVTDSSRPVEK